MPGCTKNQINDLKTLIGSKKMIYGCVNHRTFVNKTKYIIDTNLLTKDKTLKKVHMMFKEAIDFDTFFFQCQCIKIEKITSIN